jgi:glycerophosphoryl diester phosphodiesterase
MSPAWLRHPIAHRGLHDGNRSVPENSIAAFRAAVEAGLAMELDVRLSADGVAVVHHDATLRRLCGSDRRVADLTAHELGRQPLAGTAATIPRLDHVLDLIAGRAPVMVEIKPLPHGTARLCRRVAELLGDYGGEVSVHSFHPGVPRWFARRSPAVARGLAAGPVRAPLLLQRSLEAAWARARTQAHFLVLPLERLADPRVTGIRDQGTPVLAFTVRTGTEQRLARARADGYFFEAWDTDDPLVDVPRPDAQWKA